jgi:NitT/TauT family transport system ATP-binding protein
MVESVGLAIPPSLTGINVFHSYHTSAGTDLRLENVNMSVQRGEIVCLLGRSGIGKSTLLKIMGGLITPDNGQVFCNQLLVSQPLSPVALVFQDYHHSVFPWLTVRKNLELGAFKTQGKKAGFYNVREAASLMEISSYLERYPDQLSGGQLQRVQIGRALVTNIEYLLLDEPDSSVDADFKRDLKQILLKLVHEKGLGIMWATHNIEDACFVADRLYLLTPGSDTSVTIRETPGHGHKGEFDNAREEVTFRDTCRCANKILFGSV